MAEDDRKLTLEEFLPYRLNVLAEIVSQSLAKLYERRFGIANPEWRVLATLGQYPRMTAKQVGAHSRMHKTKVSRAVAALEAKGLIERSANADDLRESFLALTAAGRDVYQKLVPDALAFSDTLFSSLSPEEQRSLETIVERLISASLALADKLEKQP